MDITIHSHRRFEPYQPLYIQNTSVTGQRASYCNNSSFTLRDGSNNKDKDPSLRINQKCSFTSVKMPQPTEATSGVSRVCAHTSSSHSKR